MISSITGLTNKKFNSLLSIFEKEYYSVFKKDSKERKRDFGGGRKSSLLDVKIKLLFILLYLKTYPTYDLMGFFFDLDGSNCCRWVNKLLPLLEKALNKKLVLPSRKIKSKEEFFQKFPHLKEVFIDATERRVQRSCKDSKQRKNYSGKKKYHTRKNLIICDEKKKILFVSPTKAGSYHDKKLFDKSPPEIPKEVTIIADKGFIGINHENIMIPKKSSKNHPLTKEEKENNKIISSFRMVVENSIANIKKMKSCSDIYRNKKGQDDTFIYLASGLANLSLIKE